MLNVKYIEAEPWLGVSEEEVVTATAQIEEENRRSDLFCGSRSSKLDDDLTSLSWLMDYAVSSSHHIDAPNGSSAGDPEPTDMLQALSKPVYRRPENKCPDEVDYKTNPTVKPPYSYANMIYMAMQASDTPKITLSCIYKWITDNFCYYRYAEPTWQNSIRHNLSLNKCFVKVPRQQNEPGKGGFWAIDPQHAERLLSGAYKHRHMPPVSINPAFANQPKAQPTFVATVKPKTGQLLKNKLMEMDQDSCFAAATWVSEDTENPFGHSSLALRVMDENEGQGVSNGPSELDPLLTSAWNEDPRLDYGRPLSPVPRDEDLMAHRNHFSGQEVLSHAGEHQELLESHSCGEEDLDDPFIESVLHNTWSDVCEMSCLDLLTSSTDNTEQLFDFEIKIESLL